MSMYRSKSTTSLIKTLQWLPITLRIHSPCRQGWSPYKSLQPWLLPLPGTHNPGVTYFSTYHYLFNTCCLYKTLGSSLAPGSLWALHNSLFSDLPGPRARREVLECPTGSTCSASAVVQSVLEPLL